MGLIRGCEAWVRYKTKAQYSSHKLVSFLICLLKCCTLLICVMAAKQLFMFTLITFIITYFVFILYIYAIWQTLLYRWYNTDSLVVLRCVPMTFWAIVQHLKHWATPGCFASHSNFALTLSVPIVLSIAFCIVLHCLHTCALCSSGLS